MPAWHSKKNDAGCACGRYLQRVDRRMDNRDQLHRISAARSSVARQPSRARARALPGPKSRPHPLHQPPRHASATTRKGTRALHRPRGPTWDPRGGRTSPSSTRGGRTWRARPRRQGNATPRRLGCNVQRRTIYTGRTLAYKAQRLQPASRQHTLIPIDINSRGDPASASRTCVVVQLHAVWALHHAACVASEAIIRAQTRCPSLRTPALTSHSRVQHCIIITPVVAAAPRAATCNIQDATRGML